jgi:hypothetical protein
VVEARVGQLQPEQMGWTARDGIDVPWFGS